MSRQRGRDLRIGRRGGTDHLQQSAGAALTRRDCAATRRSFRSGSASFATARYHSRSSTGRSASSPPRRASQSACGFRPDYRSWLPWPDAFDTWGFPLTQDGASTVIPGLYFVGVHFLRKRKSSLLIGVGEDAAIVVRQITKAYSVSR
jgi:hypothetical protein